MYPQSYLYHLRRLPLSDVVTVGLGVAGLFHLRSSRTPPHPTTMKTLVITVIVGILTLALAIWFFGLQVAAWTFWHVSTTRLTPVTVRAFEWRANKAAVLPTLRIERADLSFHLRCRAEGTAMIVLTVVGVVFRDFQDLQIGKSRKKGKGASDKSGGWMSAKEMFWFSFYWLVNKVIARGIALHIMDIRAIRDDLGGLELPIDDIHILFTLKHNARRVTALTDKPTHSSPETTQRSLEPPSTSSLPSADPSVTFADPFSGGVVRPPSPGEEEHSGFAHLARLSLAKRKATQSYQMVTSTAGQAFFWVFGGSDGLLEITGTISSFSLILPHGSDLSLASKLYLSSSTSVNAPSTVHRPSAKSARYSTTKEAGYSTLASISGTSKVTFTLGFRPGQGWFPENTLTAAVHLGRAEITVGGLDKAMELVKKGKLAKSKDLETAAPATPKGKMSPKLRTILLAFKEASISVEKVSISHHLTKKPSRLSSASSSASDITLTPPREEDILTLALEVNGTAIAIKAADASNNPWAKNAFGSNTSLESRIRGLGLNIQWSGVAVQCSSPGDAAAERTQLVAIRRGDIDGFSSWKPAGWPTGELLFAGDANDSLVVGAGSVASVDITADLPLVQELKDAISEYKRSTADDIAAKLSPPSTETPEITSPATPPPPIPTLPPRLRLGFTIGPTMVAVTDKIGDQRTTVSMALDGGRIGSFTSYEDIVGRRRITEQRKIFEEEDQLYKQREADGSKFCGWLPNGLHRPRHRRNAAHALAVLEDDLSFRMRVDGHVEVQPISIHLVNEQAGKYATYEMVSVGRIHGTASGSISGRTDITDDGSDLPGLDMSARSIFADFGIDGGVQANLSELPVIKALVAMGNKRQHPTPSSVPSAAPIPILHRLPSGVTLRLSLGSLSAFIGHPDLNPKCERKLIRGLSIRTSVFLEHAYFTRTTQYPRDRGRISEARKRAELRLREDVVGQAIAYSDESQSTGGRAALSTIAMSDLLVLPIYNGEKFLQAGGLRSVEDQIGGKPKNGKRKKAKGKARQENNEKDEEPAQTSDGISNAKSKHRHQAERPIIRLSTASINIMLRQDTPQSLTGVHVTGKTSRLVVDGDMSHVYSALVANYAIKRILTAWKRPSMPRPTTPSFKLSVSVRVPAVAAHIVFPLGEHITLDIGQVVGEKPSSGGPALTTGRMMLYVRSPKEEGMWEELGRIKDLRVAAPLSVEGESPRIDVSAECFRLQIPSNYKLADLILNVNVTIKSLNTLSRNSRGGEFWTTHRPRPEVPKRAPNMRISIKQWAIEAMDDPIESKLKVVFRAGLPALKRRNELEDMMQEKLDLLEDPESLAGQDGKGPRLTANAKVSAEEARYRLDWHQAREWVAAHQAAVKEVRDREAEKRTPFYMRNSDNYLEIKIYEREPAPPLFRILFGGVKLDVSSLRWSQQETVDYMSECSLTPFAKDVEFSLMVPLHLDWAMDSASLTLRDYPLPLVRMRSSNPDIPVWSVSTPFILAEEYHGENTWFTVPTEILPAGLGEPGAAGLSILVSKTITPVKTYTQPIVKIRSKLTSEFAWGNSYQPAIQDMMKIMDTISHSPKDPSEKPGFWDKFRLILHWRVQLDFNGPVHLHYKGSTDPYLITGHGAGFAFVWRHGTRFRIGYTNKQYELIQAESEGLMVVIPELTNTDGAIGPDRPLAVPVAEEVEPTGASMESAIQREYTKPCALFVGGIRIGFGFKYERTCRDWNCMEGCGSTDKLARRHCRLFDFKDHQDVILQNPEAVKREVEELGRAVDSYEGFRSDFIHFSISCVSTKTGQPASNLAETSSLHFSPKASAHFFAWWHTFNSALSLPIKKGALFPNSPPPSKKFGRHLGTIKYRMDLSDVYVSHVYSQVVERLWEEGKSQFLGVKGRFGRVQVDGHQRQQEQIVRHEKLNRVQSKPHKPFYAVEILLDDVVAKGVVAEFIEASLVQPNDAAMGDGKVDEAPELVHVSELPDGQKQWYNFFDYIDADRQPFDKNPRFQVVDLADCPQLSYGKRLRAQEIDSDDDDSEYSLSSDMERTKFGHEETHICNLGHAPSVAAVQVKLAELRMAELLRVLTGIQNGTGAEVQLSEKDCKLRLKSIQKYIDHLRSEENRCMDGNTLQSPHPNSLGCVREDDDFFRNQIYVHSPRIICSNSTRKLAERYFYSRSDRVQEERMVSHTSLREVRRGIARIRHREAEDRANPQPQSGSDSLAFDLEREIENLLCSGKDNSRVFLLPSDIGATRGDRRLAAMGIPVDSSLVSMTNITLFKPQIVLRSEINDDSIVLLAVEEIAFRGYDVVDVATEHRAAEQILARNYIYFNGLQAFYPTEENVRRSKAEAGTAHSLGFLPLEIFLDDKNEAIDYHRIVSKTDAGISIDMFNRLRLPRGVEWPDAKDDNGMRIEHLRIHQDMYNIVLPRMTVSSTSKHYAALYNIATNLLIYQDPRHRERSQRIDSFLLAFDRKDRDPVRTIIDLFHQQQATIRLNQALQSYEADMDNLDDEDKRQLFHLRNELLEHMEQLFTVFDAIAIATKREKARASQVHSSRVNIMAGSIAWAMKRDDLDSLLKLEIDGTVFSYISNKDGSTDQALRINDLTALNPSHNAHFSEVLTRLDVGGARKNGIRKAFASAAWSVASPVGGIPIWKEARFELHPLRIALEELIAHQVTDYVFPNRDDARGRKQEKEKGKKVKGKGSPDGGPARKGEMVASSSTLELPPLARSRSAVSISSMATGQERSKGDERFTLVSSEDADIMRERAAARNFHSIEVSATLLSLTYKSGTRKKRSLTIPDCADLRIKTSDLRYANKILTFSQLFDLLKAACVKEAWSQSGSILSQMLSKTSVVRSKASLEKRFHTLRSDVPAKFLGSKLTYEVEYPPSEPSSPHEGRTSPVDSTNPLMRVLSRKSPRASGVNGDGLAISPISPLTPRRLSTSGREAPKDLRASNEHREGNGHGSDEEEELEGEGDSGGDGGEVRVGKVRGFLERLGRKKDHSSDDLNGSPTERRTPRAASSSSSLQTPMSFPSYH